MVRTPDTDIFFILLHHAKSIPLTIYIDIGTGKHRQIINVSKLAESKGEDYYTTVLGLYVFTGEDVTSTFKGKWKVGTLFKSSVSCHANQVGLIADPTVSIVTV